MTPAGTVLAFDFGTKRVGVAVGTTEVAIANPLGTIEGEANAARFAALEKYVTQWQPALLVVGRPRHADGTQHETARLAEKFARRLRERFKLPVVFVDETLSSAEAAMRVREARAGGSRKADLDAMAATVILQSFLDSPSSHERLAS